MEAVRRSPGWEPGFRLAARSEGTLKRTKATEVLSSFVRFCVPSDRALPPEAAPNPAPSWIFMPFMVKILIIQEHHRLVGRDLVSPSALRAVHRVVNAIQVIAQLLEHGAVPGVSAAGRPLFPLAQEPLNLIVVSMPALWTPERHGLHFGELVEAVPFVQRHAAIV
jgi:hypothetical protein